jgi:galactose-1-phosphate uridylyltransferase
MEPERRYANFMITMPDGTVKMINPLTGREAWSVPGRSSRPITNVLPAGAKPLEPRAEEDYCNFCETRTEYTPPEKDRLVARDGGLVSLPDVPASKLQDSVAEFRRIPNLFEIITYEYWVENYGYKLSPKNARRMEAYLSEEAGRRHAIETIEMKLHLSGRAADDVSRFSEADKLRMAEAFFGGSHELIVARRHYRRGAQYDADLASSGELTPDEHAEYMRFTVQAIQDIYAQNRYVRYVVTFQNWLRPAGASFDHLHKQLVGLDAWGTFIEREAEVVRQNPNVYNEDVVNFAGYQNRIIAENDHAVLFADIGHRYPTLAIYSKSPRLRPWEHAPEEIRGVSDLVHAAHAAQGAQISCNEEWYYAPRDSLDRIPWHVLIKWRVNNPAGFEGGTAIYVNPIGPFDVRDAVVPRLYELRDRGALGNLAIAEECVCAPNSLRYLDG